MATLSKLTAALLHLEKDDDDTRKVVVKTQKGKHVFKIVKVSEGEWEGKSKIILWAEEI